MFNGGRVQRERPQDKKPHTDQGVPPVDQYEIEPVDDILAELEKLKEANKPGQKGGCGCWGDK